MENASINTDATRTVEVTTVQPIFIVKAMVNCLLGISAIFTFSCQPNITEVTRHGVVMCTIGNSGYYPAAFYVARRGLCTFDKIFPILSLEPFYRSIQYVISKCISNRRFMNPL